MKQTVTSNKILPLDKYCCPAWRKTRSLVHCVQSPTDTQGSSTKTRTINTTKTRTINTTKIEGSSSKTKTKNAP